MSTVERIIVEHLIQMHRDLIQQYIATLKEQPTCNIENLSNRMEFIEETLKFIATKGENDKHN